MIRGNDTIHVTATPNGAGKLGFELKSPVDIFEVKVTQYGMFEAIPVGIKDGTDFLVTYVSSLKHLFSKEGAESVGGFGAIGNMFPPKWDWRTFWEMTAFLSIILAFMNIIPIPALDGGHVASCCGRWLLAARLRKSSWSMPRPPECFSSWLCLSTRTSTTFTGSC